MDAQCVLDTALAANATTLGSADAAQIFRNTLKSALKVNVNLLPGQKAQLQKLVTYPLIFMGGKTVTNDHPLLVACRDVARDIFEAETHATEVSERTLVVGASAREIRKYNSNPHIHYHIHGKEAKDYDRIVRPALQEICRKLKEKASKTNFTVFMKPPAHEDNTKMRPVVKRYWKMQEVFKDYMELHRMPANIHVGNDLPKCNTLIFEDSFYNFGVAEYLDIFQKTGAQIAYGYGLLPMELLFPEMAENPLYTVTRDQDKTTLVFRNGFCNGYVHDTEKWETLLRSPVMHKPGVPFNLVVEIVARVGPAAVFKIMRTTNGEKIVRALELSERERYVKILDIPKCVNPNTGRVNSPLVYFSVHESEYLDVYNYATSLDPKSVTFQNIVAYIRRRMGGMSLITKELLEPWFLPKSRVADLALIVLLEVRLRTEQRTKVQENIDIGSFYEKFRAMIRMAGKVLFYPIAEIINWLYAGHLVDKLVLFPSGVSYQVSDTKHFEVNDGLEGVGLYLDNPYEGDIPSCPICFELMGKLGDQIVDCQHTGFSQVDLKLTDDQIKIMKATLADTDRDPPGLAEIKSRCAKAMPNTGFSRRVTAYYIKAGPGCGKSHLIRQLASTHDLVVAPFNKLRPDYMGLQADNGDKYDLLFKTTHRAMESRGNRRIFIDEFTSLPYEYLACIAEQNGAEEIFLVGDDKQTKVQEPAEGLYIGNYIDLTKLSTHELLVNFRNPQDTVALLNRVYGYRMQAASKVERSIEFLPQGELPQDIVASKICFSKMSSKLITEDESNTVRSFQGSTVDRVVLYVNQSDGTLPSVEELQIVALSRHREKLYIAVDGCAEAYKLQAKMDLSPEFYDHMQTWLSFPREDVQPLIAEDAVVELITKPIQPPRDMYLMVETFIPSAAFDDQSTSMNLLPSACVPAEFNTGKTHPDLIIMPLNKRGHPKSLKTTYYSVGQGVGNHFSAVAPVQTLQVLQARYFNKPIKKPFTHSEKQLAVKMVNLWFEEHVQPNWRANLMDDAEITEVLKAFIAHVTTRNYQRQFEATGGLDNPDGRVIRFNLKHIFKPKTGEPDVYKAGQGISAWSTDACAMFCSVFRILTRLVSKTEQQHVITDAYKSECEFVDEVKAKMMQIPSVALNATTDATQFDANQNEFTQFIEREYWKKYGVSEEFLDCYYSFRRNYKVISSVALGFAQMQKTSGEPGTLVNNGAVSKIVSNYICRGEGPTALVYKGDDFSKRQLNIQVDKERKAKVENAVSLGLKVKIAPSAEFCGLVFSEGNLFPSIPRKLNKIVAHRFNDYKHFCEYQASLRDWINNISHWGEMMVISCNLFEYKCSYAEMSDCLDTIKSFAHIDEDQFQQKFQLKTEELPLPVGDLFGKIQMVMG